MKVWVCRSCYAQIPVEVEPKFCALCGQSSRGFDEGYKEDKPDADKDDSKRYKEALDMLKKYDEGCEPETFKDRCEC